MLNLIAVVILPMTLFCLYIWAFEEFDYGRYRNTAIIGVGIAACFIMFMLNLLTLLGVM